MGSNIFTTSILIEIIYMIILNRIKDINGRALMRMNDEKLQIIGIENSSHRYEILKEIYKQVYIFFYFIRINTYL